MTDKQVKNLFLKFIEEIPGPGSDFLSAKTFLLENSIQDISIIHSFICFLQLFNVIKVVKFNDDFAISYVSEISQNFVISLSEYIKYDFPLVSNWDIGHSAESESEMLMWGQKLLHTLEQRRVNYYGSNKTLKDVWTIQLIIKAFIAELNNEVFLFQFSPKVLRYQHIGGYLLTEDSSIESAIQRLLNKELSLNKFETNTNFKFEKFYSEIYSKGISRKNSVYTSYHAQAYYLSLNLEDFKLSPEDRWITLDEMIKGVTNDGLQIKSSISDLEGKAKEDYIDSLRNLKPSLTTIQKTNYYIKQDKSKSFNKNISEIFKSEESVNMEFKSSARWDQKLCAYNKDLENPIIKTVAGFMNSKGGTLVIGVDDNKNILGIDPDLSTLSKQNEDGYFQFLTNLFSNNFGSEFVSLIHIRFEHDTKRTVCIITVESAKKPIFIKRGEQRDFFIRTGNITKQLNSEEVYNYIQLHW